MAPSFLTDDDEDDDDHGEEARYDAVRQAGCLTMYEAVRPATSWSSRVAES